MMKVAPPVLVEGGGGGHPLSVVQALKKYDQGWQPQAGTQLSLQLLEALRCQA